GNREAFHNLVERYKSPIYTLCLYLTRNVQNAEDLVQETFIRLYKNLNHIEPKAQFKTFILGIARNLALNQIRNEKRKNNFLARLFNKINSNYEEQVNYKSEMWPPDEKQEFTAVVQQCMLELSTEHREILILRETQGLDYESIAKILGCRVGTVRSRLARARAQLRKIILEKGITIQ
ncbi:MAG: RNA polymerase sigma factor, partial [Candidatus Hydrogenedens sp.]